MDIYKELCDLKETIGNEISQANKEIKKAGGDLNTGDIEMIDKLTHSMKSLITSCAMLEADEGYSGDYMPMGTYYSRNDEPGRRYSRNYSGTYGREGRNDSRYSRNGYSRGVNWNEHLRMMMDEAPDEATRMDIKKLMDRMAG